jgi:hypothetical protein
VAATLTLDQVIESGRFAWHVAGYLYINGEIFSAIHMEPPSVEGYAHALRVRRSSLRDAQHKISDGWNHAEGCGCRWCAPSDGDEHRH